MFFNFLTLLYFDPAYLGDKGGATGPPNWVYYTWAAGLFFYQSFDAIDGLVLFVTLAHEGALTQLARAAESRHEGRAWQDL